MPKILRINPDYDCPPIWAEDEADYLDPDDLPITESLILQIKSWQAEFDILLDREDGRRSGFKSEGERVEFHHRGLDLARRLQTELGTEYEVYYQNQLVQQVAVV